YLIFQRPNTLHHTLDTLGLLCPLPIIETAKKIKEINIGEVLEVLSDDGVIRIDMPAWCLSTGPEYLGYEEDGRTYRVYVRKQEVSGLDI
ncbi:MAG: sulfurtransferase TusA family protein, partial [Candidatus Binatia bacterium]